MIKVFTHAGNVLIQAQETNEILTNVYDSGYPFVTWHNCINFIGGAKGKEDKSPISIITREFEEEFSLGPNEMDATLVAAAGSGWSLPKVGKMASKQDIDNVRNSILSQIQPYKDFLVETRGIEKLDGNKYDQVALFSVFVSQIPQDIFEIQEET